MSEERVKYLLDEAEIPTAWLNILPRLPEPLPAPLNPATREPVKPEELAAIFPEDLILQEVSLDPWIEIPGPVLDAYRLYRPTPLLRARRLERALETPARIYYKYEGVSPAGSHKPNTALAQAYYNKRAGVRRLTTETGAGQWGSALAMACRFFDLDCRVYMVRISYEQKPYRRVLMQTWGAEVVPSPSKLTEAGRKALERDPATTGSLGIAISEAVEDAATHPDTNYSLGSVLNHVLLHQTVIGLEARAQMEKAGDYPDVVVGCIGGGSNFAGLSFPFLADKLEGRRPDLRVVAVEPTACPTLTAGEYRYDFGDAAGLTPLLKMHTLGHDFLPPPIHAGGLRYHGDAPSVCLLYERGLIEAAAYPQTKVFEAAVRFTRAEGVIPAPESAHAVAYVVDEALACREKGVSRAILFNLSGHGLLDLQAYDDYLSGNLMDV